MTRIVDIDDGFTSSSTPTTEGSTSSFVEGFANDAAYDAAYTKVAGSTYWNTTDKVLKIYDGSAWVVYAKTNSTTSNPTTTDDASEGYGLHSTWINTTSDTAFICVDATTDAAVWQEIGAGGSSSTLEVLHLTGLTGFGSTNTYFGNYTTETTNTLSTLATLTNTAAAGAFITADADCMVHGAAYIQHTNGANLFWVRNPTDKTAAPTTEASALVVNNKSGSAFLKQYLPVSCYLESGDELCFYTTSTSSTDDANWLIKLYLTSV